jgi:hypothetical protein
MTIEGTCLGRVESLTDLLGKEIGGEIWDRLTVHHKATHGSWLNQPEIDILSRQCIGKRRIPGLSELRQEARAWNRRMNRNRVCRAWKVSQRRYGDRRG